MKTKVRVDMVRLRELALEGVTHANMAKELGVTVHVVFNRLKEMGMVEINEGSDRIGISPITARRYLLKKLATTFVLGPGPRGHKLIKWRSGQ